MKTRGFQLYAGIMFFISVTFLCSCSDEDPGFIVPEPDNKHPVSFITYIDGSFAARATTGNSWAGDEQISVRFGDTGMIKQYQISQAGELTCATPFYWESTNPVTVTAWYPHSAVQPAVFTVKTDQSSTGYEESDMLMACGQVVPQNSSLNFSHLPVKIVINLKGDENAGDISSAGVSIVNVSATSGTIITDSTGKITVEKPALPGDVTIIPQDVAQVTPGYQKTVQALIVPQNKDNSQFIRINFNGKDFYYTPVTGEADITSGNMYTYNIIVRGTLKSIEAKSYRSRISQK